MIRPTPRIGDSGGSSGCIASSTPACSATGTTRRKEVLEVLPQLVLADRAPPSAASPSPCSKPLTSEPPREGMSVRGAQPVEVGHPLVAPGLIPSRPMFSSSVEHRGDLLVAPGRATLRAVERRSGLEDLEGEAVLARTACFSRGSRGRVPRPLAGT